MSPKISLKHHLMNFTWIFASICLLLFHTSSAIYVNPNNPNNSPTGSIDDPFRTIKEAIESGELASGDIILQGESFTIEEKISFPNGSNYTIKTETTNTDGQYFPLYLGPGASISILSAFLTLEGIEIIDLDPERLEAAFFLQNASLVFTRTLVQNIQSNLYQFISTDMNLTAELKIVDSTFRNLTNAQLMLFGTKVTITNSSFSELTQNASPLLIIVSTLGETRDASFSEVTIRDSRLGNMVSLGFITVLSSAINISFKSLTVKDVTFTGNSPLIAVASSFDDLTRALVFSMNDVYVENLVQEFAETYSESDFKACFIDASGPNNFKFNNLTVKGVHFLSSDFINLSPTYTTGSSANSSVEFNNITVQNTSHAGHIISKFKTMTLEDLKVYENYVDVDAPPTSQLFSTFKIKKVIVQNVKVKNNTGSIFQMNEVENLQITDCDFDNVFTSKSLTGTVQPLLFIQRESKTGAALIEKYDITIQRFNVKGFTEINGANQSVPYVDFYMMRIESTYGRVFLQDSVWYKSELPCFLSTEMKYLQIKNLTVENNPFVSPGEASPRRAFQFINVEEIQILNSTFLHNKNFIIFNLHNIRRSDFYNTLEKTRLVFKDLRVIDNAVDFLDQELKHESLFSINNPFVPCDVTFEDSVFEDNLIVKGIILIHETSNVNLHILKSSFKRNFSFGKGVALVIYSTEESSENMIVLKYNIFEENKCVKDGGIFSFLHANLDIKSTGNIYLNNHAQGSGGVGHASSSNLMYTEDNATYIDKCSGNSADKFGGCWYIDMEEDIIKPSFNISNSVFKRSKANQSGGSIYLATGDLFIDNSTFTGNEATLSGGDLYFLVSCSAQIRNSTFNESFSLEGSFLYAEALIDKTIYMDRVQVVNSNTGNPNSLLVKSHSGFFEVYNSLFQNISNKVFDLWASNMKLENVTIDQIVCTSSSVICIFEGSGGTLELRNSSISNVIFDSAMIDVEYSPFIAIDNTRISKVQTVSASSAQEQIYGLNIINVTGISIRNSVFEDFACPFINIQGTDVEITGTTFSNLQQERLLQQSTAAVGAAAAPVISKSNQAIQFLVLDLCKTTISQSSFLGNAGNNKTNGGAIQMTNGGTLKAIECIFEGNTGENGGAIAIDDNVDALIIENSKFINNQATSKGGAIFINDNSVKDTVTIVGSAFTQNHARLGGALYVLSQETLVKKSNFTANSAMEGGGITSYSQNEQKITLSSNIFTANAAKRGSAAMSYATLIVDDQTNQYIENEGESFASVPTEVSMRIFKVPSIFLYLEGFSIEDILSHQGTSLVFDSENQTTKTPLMQKPGKNPEYLYEFSFLDGYGKKIAMQENTTIEISVLSYEASTEIDKIGVIGDPQFTFRNSSMYSFNSFAIRGDFGSELTISAKANYLDYVHYKQEFAKPALWQVIMERCARGDTFDRLNLMCTPCAYGTYSYEDPFTIKTCKACPHSAICLGGDVIFPMQGYWRIDSLSENFIKCRNHDACLGGLRGDREISLTGFCENGYEGAACSQCSPGYAKLGNDQSCSNCQKSAIYYFLFLLYFLIQIGLMIYTIRAYLNYAETADKKETKTDIHRSTLIKIIIDFIQVLNIISAFSFDWPNVMGTLLQVVTKTAPTNGDGLSVDCFIVLIMNSDDEVFFTKLLLIIFQPFIYMAVALLFWIIRAKVTKQTRRVYKAKIYLSFISIIYILQPGIIQTVLQLYKYLHSCKNFGDDDSSKLFLQENTDIECWTLDHLTWGLGVGITALVVWVILPCGLLAISIVKRRFFKPSSWINHQYDYLFDKYQKRFEFWELVVFSRKLFMIIILIFVASGYLQAYLSFFVIFISFHLQFKIMPYSDNKHKSINKAESMSLAALAFIVYSGLFFIRDPDPNFVTYLIFTMDVLGGALFLGYSIYLLKDYLLFKLIQIKNGCISLWQKVFKRLPSSKHKSTLSLSDKGPSQASQDQLDEFENFSRRSALTIPFPTFEIELSSAYKQEGLPRPPSHPPTLITLPDLLKDFSLEKPKAYSMNLNSENKFDKDLINQKTPGSTPVITPQDRGNIRLLNWNNIK